MARTKSGTVLKSTSQWVSLHLADFDAAAVSPAAEETPVALFSLPGWLWLILLVLLSLLVGSLGLLLPSWHKAERCKS